MYIHHIALSKTDIHLIKQEVVIGDNHTELSNLHVLVQITVHSTVRTYRSIVLCSLKKNNVILVYVIFVQ